MATLITNNPSANFHTINFDVDGLTCKTLYLIGIALMGLEQPTPAQQYESLGAKNVNLFDNHDDSVTLAFYTEEGAEEVKDAVLKAVEDLSARITTTITHTKLLLDAYPVDATVNTAHEGVMTAFCEDYPLKDANKRSSSPECTLWTVTTDNALNLELDILVHTDSESGKANVHLNITDTL